MQRWGAWFSILVWMLFCSVGGAFANGMDAKDSPSVDLSDWSFLKEGAYRLEHGWTVYRDIIIDPKGFSADNCRPASLISHHSPDVISAPDVWGPAFTRTVTSGHGQATYCLALTLPEDGHFHSVLMGTLRSVAAIYAVYTRGDGTQGVVLLHKNGDPRLNIHQVINNPAIPIVDLPYGVTQLAYVLQVSNNIHKQGGMIEVPKIDIKWQLEAQENKSTSLPGALGIVLILVAVAAAIVGLRHSAPQGHYIFAFLNLAAAVRVIFVSDIIWDYFPMFPLERKYDLEYLSLFLIGSAYYAFISYLFREKVLKFDLIVYGISAAMIIYTLFIAPFYPPGTITLIREAMQLFWGLIGIGIVHALIRAFSRNPEKTKEALIVISAGLITLAYEVLSVSGILELSLEWSQFIVVIVMLMYARVFVINSRRIEDERDKLTEKLTKTNEDLRQRAVALDLALVRAEEASKTKSEFLATISHELRTPLNAIIGFSDLILRQLFGPIGDKKYVDYVSDIHESGMHLLALVNDILDLSSIEADADPLNEQEVNIRPLIEYVLKLLRVMADKRHIECASSVPFNTPYLLGDERKIKQILINLVNNAIKFNKENGTVDVSVRTDKTGFYIDITDTGIGIDQSDIPHVLTRFGQVDSKVNRKYGGVGIGLPLSQALIHQHEGKLTIKSELGKGTTITVHFPPERIIERPDRSGL